jgi:hypothetical protein
LWRGMQNFSWKRKIRLWGSHAIWSQARSVVCSEGQVEPVFACTLLDHQGGFLVQKDLPISVVGGQGTCLQALGKRWDLSPFLPPLSSLVQLRVTD